MIVKIQLPIIGSNALIYNKDNSFVCDDVSVDYLKKVFGEKIENRFFADIKLNKKCKIIKHEILPEQNW